MFNFKETRLPLRSLFKVTTLGQLLALSNFNMLMEAYVVAGGSL